MNLDRVQAIVNAVLYEGYILYPYRPSAVKNRQRWTFGGLYPEGYGGVQEGSEPCRMQTQCLIEGSAGSRLNISVRFLHVVAREIGELPAPLAALPAGREPLFTPIEMLEVGGQRFYAWQEAVEREVVVPILGLDELMAGSGRTSFAFSGKRELEPLRASDERITGLVIRTQMAVHGEVTAAAERVDTDVFRITVSIVNNTALEPAQDLRREAAQLQAFASTHTFLGVRDGEFVSPLDPPERLCEAAADCNNVGTYPVLVGEEGERDTMLSSPIILYDYPEIAPESPGDLFDGTEIDEILSLRILAMTDDEKREMVATDPRARMLLERTENLTAEQLNKLHGALRHLRPVVGHESGDPPGNSLSNPFAAWDAKPQLAFLKVAGRELRVGDKVRLHPKGGADIMDLALNGKVAVIEAIERDFEDKVHVAVAVDDDPGREFGLARMPGHRFFFSPAEIEPLESPEQSVISKRTEKSLSRPWERSE